MFTPKDYKSLFPMPLNDLGFPLSNLFSSLDVDDCGVYIVHDSGIPLYVGMSMDFTKRLSRACKHHEHIEKIIKIYPSARIVLISFPWENLDWSWLDEPAFQLLCDSERDKAELKYINKHLRYFEYNAMDYYKPSFNRT
ncbi:hypothetical protein [Methylobacter tundripaludum]